MSLLAGSPLGILKCQTPQATGDLVAKSPIEPLPSRLWTARLHLYRSLGDLERHTILAVLIPSKHIQTRCLDNFEVSLSIDPWERSVSLSRISHRRLFSKRARTFSLSSLWMNTNDARLFQMSNWIRWDWLCSAAENFQWGTSLVARAAVKGPRV